VPRLRQSVLHGRAEAVLQVLPMARRALLTLILCFASLNAGDSARVRFLWPTIHATDQQSTTWLVVVEPVDENRHLYLRALDGDFVARSSYVQLDGERAAKTHRIAWGPLPAGELTILATVENSTRIVATAKTTLRVIGFGP
jgi:hypothetical protein